MATSTNSRGREAAIRSTNDKLFQAERRIGHMLEQEVTPGALTAVYTLVVAEDVLYLIQSLRVEHVVKVLAAVTAYNFHLQPSGDSLAFIAVFVVFVFGCRARIAVELPSLGLSSLLMQRVGVEGITIQHVGCRTGLGRPLISRSGVRAAKISLTRRGSRATDG